MVLKKAEIPIDCCAVACRQCRCRSLSRNHSMSLWLNAFCWCGVASKRRPLCVVSAALKQRAQVTDIMAHSAELGRGLEDKGIAMGLPVGACVLWNRCWRVVGREDRRGEVEIFVLRDGSGKSKGPSFTNLRVLMAWVEDFLER